MALGLINIVVTLTLVYSLYFFHASVELANQVADSQVDKSTYQTWFDN